MCFFTQIENSHVLLRKNGIFTEAPLYKYEDILYAKQGSGFVRLKPNQATSVQKLIWETIDLDPSQGKVKFDTFNALIEAPKHHLHKAA